MPDIRPVSDLRNNFADIARAVKESDQPVFLTKNGYGEMVVMSMAAYERSQFDGELYAKLKEAELEANSTAQRLSHEQVFGKQRQKLARTVSEDV